MAKAQSQKPTANWQDVFVDQLAKFPNVTAAAKKAKISRAQVYLEKTRDPDFAARWEDALAQGVDAADSEVYRRGVTGWNEPVYHAGVRVGYIRKYSDGLLQFYLKAHSKKYRDASSSSIELEHKGSIKSDVNHSITGETAQSIFDVLAAAGVLGSGPDDATDEHVHTP